MASLYYLIESSLFGFDFLHSIFGINIPDWVCSKRPLPDYGIFKESLENKLKLTSSKLSKAPFPKEKIQEILPLINNMNSDLRVESTDSFHASLCYPKHPFWSLYMNKTKSLSLDKEVNTKRISWEYTYLTYVGNRRLFFFCYKSWILGVCSYLQKSDLIQIQDLSLFSPFESQSELLKMKLLEFAKKKFAKNQKIAITDKPDFNSLHW